MVDKIKCPSCHKMNEVHKFCIYCGHKLLDDKQIELILDNPEPYCLNCGRPIKKGQSKCECGYEFRIMDCPKCNAKNSYTNRFCTECGEKLWTSDVCEINYGKIESMIIKDRFPQEMRDTILYLRYKKRLGINFPDDFSKIGSDEQQLQSNKSRVEDHLSEIFARWKIVSPHYCINCLSIMNVGKYRCKKCGTFLPYAEERVNQIKNKKYKKPVFDIVELKSNSKFSENYLDSLAPSMGESQFEYRERLKWEFAENINLKKSIINAIQHQINRKKKEEERRKQAEEFKKWEEERKERKKRQEEYIRQYGGGFCDYSCRYCYEEFFDSRGAVVGDIDNEGYSEYYCSLGHSLNYGSYCKDYE